MQIHKRRRARTQISFSRGFELVCSFFLLTKSFGAQVFTISLSNQLVALEINKLGLVHKYPLGAKRLYSKYP